MKPLSESLNTQIVKHAPPYIVVPDAPNTYADLKRYGIDDKGRIRVSPTNSINTIYADKQVNYAFRAWHDSLHLKYVLSFSLSDELKVAQLHQRLIIGNYEKALIYIDVAEQARYWYVNRKYVENQREFVLDFIN